MQNHLNSTNKLVKNKGAALITALFIMAIVAAAAVFMSLQQAVSIRRTQELIATDQAYLYAESVSAWAMGLLRENAIHAGENDIIDSLPKKFPPFIKNPMTISGNLIDLESRFNLNNLIDKKHVKRFAKLILMAASDTKEETANQIAEATYSWVNKETAFQDDDKKIHFDPLYLKKVPPYRAAHYPMVSPSELRLVEGMSAKLYLQLEPYITTLPEFTPININTASAIVLASLGDLSLKEAETLVSDRKNTLFKSVDDFMKTAKIAKTNINIKELTIVSSYFLSTANVRYGNNSITEYNLLKREISSIDETKSAELTLLWTSHGAW